MATGHNVHYGAVHNRGRRRITGGSRRVGFGRRRTADVAAWARIPAVRSACPAFLRRHRIEDDLRPDQPPARCAIAVARHRRPLARTAEDCALLLGLMRRGSGRRDGDCRAAAGLHAPQRIDQA